MIFLLSILGFVAYFFTHCLWISQIPGLHFDEAWAAYFSHLISTGATHGIGSVPLEAMSPYTVPWSHFFTALFYSFFGTHLWVSRLSGVVLSALGIFFMQLGLFRLKRPEAAAIFPWICAFFVPLVLNHRFAIEITTFHVFCFGLLVLGLITRKLILIGIALYLGITAHILFLGIALATWLTRRLQPEPLTRSERTLIVSLCACLLPFLIRVYLRIPEHDKAIALLLINAAIAGDALVPKIGDWIIKKVRKPFLIFALLLSLPGLFFTLFFSEGHWNVLFNYGQISHPELIGISWSIMIAGLGYGSWKYYRKNGALPYSQTALLWATLNILMISLISTKPTSRYYETGFLCLAFFAAVSISELSKRAQGIILSAFVFTSSLQLGMNYFQAGLEKKAVERGFAFGIFHDSSSDFLPKQDVVDFLAAQGCSFAQVQAEDPRLFEALRFLSLGDWKEGHCKWSLVSVSRKSQRATPLPEWTRVAELEGFVVDAKKE
jgi:hypothetical protein